MSLETMQQRLNYKGGAKLQERMIADKLWSLRSAIKRSYQAVTIETSKGKRFRCLLNPDNLKPDYDMKILSIPYQNIDLNDTRKQRTSEGYVDIEMDGGEVFTCLDDGTKWIIYMKHLNEKAYLRAECRLCEAFADIDGTDYPVYIRGPVETKINWLSHEGVHFNKPNYTLDIYITKDEKTLEYFKRFNTVKIDGYPYQVEAKNMYEGDGIIQITLMEYYRTTLADEAKEFETPKEEQLTQIEGPQEVEPWGICSYSIKSETGGVWEINNKKAKIIKATPTFVTIEVISGKSGEFTLSYKNGDTVIDEVNVQITSM